MYVDSSYVINLYGIDEDIQKVSEWIEEELEDFCYKSDKNTIEVEEENVYVFIDNIVNDLAINMIKTAPEITFSIDGYENSAESEFEVGTVGFRNFFIEYKDKKLTLSYTYVYNSLSYMFEDYDEFCQQFCDEEGKPFYTEEQYDEFMSDEYFVLWDSEKGSIVQEIPFYMIEQIKVES